MNSLERVRRAKSYVGREYRLGRDVVRLRWRESKNRDSWPLVLVTDFREFTSDQQYAPIRRHNRHLYDTRGVNAAVLSTGHALRNCRSVLRDCEAVGVKLSYRTPADQAAELVSAVRSEMSGGSRLIYFDGDDDLNIQWPQVLRISDVYVKKHMFSDATAYLREYRGKSNLSDYVAQRFGPTFEEEEVRTSGPLQLEDLSRLHLGWNIGLDDRIYKYAQGVLSPAAGERPIDVSGRATARKRDWVWPLRRDMAIEMRNLAKRWTVALPEGRVSPEEYYQELRSSAICVSPFGYGEICWRDFEAILSGCLLVKPDMAHVRTEPNIYVPGVTYAPVRWDFADLMETCETYLQDRERLRRVAAQAQETVLQALGASWFAERLGGLRAVAGNS